MHEFVYISKCIIEFSQHATESPTKLREGLNLLFPENIRDIFLSTLKISQLEGFYKNPISLWLIESAKKHWNDIFFNHMIQNLIITTIFEELFERYNYDNNSLYLRLNKQLLIGKKQYILDQGSDVIKIMFRFRQTGKIANIDEVIKQILQNYFST